MHTYAAAVIGAGQAGLSAVKEIRQVTNNFVLVDAGRGAGPSTGRSGVCAEGTIPLDEMFHVRTRRRLGDGGDPSPSALDPGGLRDTVARLPGRGAPAALTAENLGGRLLRGHAEFLDAHTLRVGDEIVRTEAAVIATGARSYVPSQWREFEADLLTDETLAGLSRLPASVAVIGLGPIGIEVLQGLHRRGVAVTGIDSGANLARVQDPVVNRIALETFAQEFPLWLGESVRLRPDRDGWFVHLSEHSIAVDKVLLALGRRPNLEGLGIERLGVEMDARGVPCFDAQTMRVGRLPIYLAGEVTGRPLSLHRSKDEGRVAGCNAAPGPTRAFMPKTEVCVVYSEPNIISVGRRFGELDPYRVAVGQADVGAGGRSTRLRGRRGVLRVYADRVTGRVFGGAAIGPHGEQLARLLGWAAENGLSVADALAMPGANPVAGEVFAAAMRELAGKVKGGTLPMPGLGRVPVDPPRDLRPF